MEVAVPATGARRGHLVYHWRHGWIPLDHFAALSKAHNSKSGAVKEMQKRGIAVPKGYHSDHKSSAPKISPAPTHSAGVDPHAIRATQLREAAAKKRAEADRIAGSAGAPESAAGRLNAKNLATVHKNTDSSLRRFTEAKNRADALDFKARLAEGRAKEAARVRYTADDLKDVTHVQDRFGQWHAVTKVNAKSVSVKYGDPIAHDKVHNVMRATPEQIAAAKAKAAAKTASPAGGMTAEREAALRAAPTLNLKAALAMSDTPAETKALIRKIIRERGKK